MKSVSPKMSTRSRLVGEKNLTPFWDHFKPICHGPKKRKNCKNAPKSAQERRKAFATQPPPALGAVLSRSWDARGPPRAASDAAKSPKMRARSQFFAIFLNVVPRINFYIDLFMIVYRFFESPTLKTTDFPIGKRRFSQNRRLRV